MIHGQDILIIANIGGIRQAIAACKSCGFNIDQSYIEACSPFSGRTTVKIPTTYDWSLDCSCLMANSKYAERLCEAVINGEVFDIEFIAAGFKYKGKAIVSKCSITGAKNSLAQLSANFAGSGPLTRAYDWDIINGTMYSYSNYDEETKTLMVDGLVNGGILEQ